MRLAKYLAHSGVASRRAAEAIIREGRVTVAGEVVRDPARDVGDQDDVALDGRALGGPERRVAYAVNKPLGVLSTASDPYDRPTVLSLVADAGARLYPVGRLDADSTGLILLTNDGELAHRLTHPSFEVPKTYRVVVSGGPVGDGALGALRAGVTLEDGPCAPARVRHITRGRGEDGARTLEITITEGRNRQVRRMFEAVGHPVLALERVAFGPLKLGRLAPGGHRRLTAAELRALRDASRPPRATRAGSGAL